jgi:membrane protease YdiL (CAAX protease family)
MPERDAPGAPSSDRTLSLIGAVGWTCLVVLFFALILSLSASFRPGLSQELVNLQICYSLALSLGTLLLVRVHLPARDVLDAIGARAAPWWLVLAGLGVGVLLQLPAQWVDGLVTQRWPLSPEDQERQAALFVFQSTGHKAAFLVAATILGPTVEEVFCRGALFRVLRRSHGALATVLITTGSFAFLHQDPRYALNAALCGLALGALRLWAGSTWVSLAAHTAFNAVTTVALLGGWVRLGEPQEPLPLVWGLLGTAALVGVLVGIRAASLRSPLALAASEEDTR